MRMSLLVEVPVHINDKIYVRKTKTPLFRTFETRTEQLFQRFKFSSFSNLLLKHVVFEDLDRFLRSYRLTFNNQMIIILDKFHIHFIFFCQIKMEFFYQLP